MPENTFQCVDDNYNLEACKNCRSVDFQIGVDFANTGNSVIICAHCARFHKEIAPSVKSAGEILDGIFEFLRKNGE